MIKANNPFFLENIKFNLSKKNRIAIISHVLELFFLPQGNITGKYYRVFDFTGSSQ